MMAFGIVFWIAVIGLVVWAVGEWSRRRDTGEPEHESPLRDPRPAVRPRRARSGRLHERRRGVLTGAVWRHGWHGAFLEELELPHLIPGIGIMPT
jgi:hypothetical protein